MHSLRSRLIFSHILPVLVIVPLLALAVYGLLRVQGSLTDIESRLAGETARLSEQAGLVASLAGAVDNLFSDPELADEFITDIDLTLSSVTLLDAGGRVLATSAGGIPFETGQELENESIAALLQGESSIQMTIRNAATARAVADVLVPVFDVEQQLSGVILLSREVGTVQRQLQRTAWLLALAFAGLLFLGVGLGALLAVRLTRSLQAVTGTVGEIAGGRTPVSLPDADVIEIHALYGAVNGLAERLQTIEETRRRMLANLVHEIGRPLGAVHAAVQALRQGADEDPALREELLVGMDDQLARMEPLLDDLTRLHGQLLGRPNLAQEETPISQWLPSILFLWQQQAEQRGLTWRVDIPLNLPAIELDRAQMARAIGNLLSNAIKYTEPGDTVAVTATVDGVETGQRALLIRIRDTGRGIAVEDQERVFDAFQRAEHDRRFPQGMGLGLAIARDIVNAHGGRILLESAPGTGSTFTIVLPQPGPAQR